MTKMIVDCEMETQAASKSVSKIRSKLSQNENATQGQKATGILQTVQTKSKATTVRVTVTAGDSLSLSLDAEGPEGGHVEDTTALPWEKKNCHNIRCHDHTNKNNWQSAGCQKTDYTCACLRHH